MQQKLVEKISSIILSCWKERWDGPYYTKLGEIRLILRTYCTMKGKCLDNVSSVYSTKIIYISHKRRRLIHFLWLYLRHTSQGTVSKAKTGKSKGKITHRFHLNENLKVSELVLLL